MWIIPKNLHTSLCARVTEGLTLDSNESSQLCAQSLFVRSKPLPSRTWSQKWKRDSWMQHLFGRILRPSLGATFVTEWTSCLEVTLANHSATQGNAEEQKTSGTCGPTLQMEFDFFAPDSASSRTSKDTSRWDSPASLVTWNNWVTRCRGDYSRRLKLAHLTNASGCSSWPSPVASEVRQGFQDRSRGMKGLQESLTTVVLKTHGQADPENPNTHGSHRELWLTPRANEPTGDQNFVERNGDRGEHCSGSLTQQGTRTNWPTPDATLANDGMPWDEFYQGMVKRRAEVKQAVAEGKTLQGNGRSPNLCAAVQNPQWATPQARDAKGAEGRMIRNGQHTDLPSQTEVAPTGQWNRSNGKLNPRWVETLMGLPVGWVMPSCASPVTIAPMNCDSSETE
jgi:hypothetical protein